MRARWRIERAAGVLVLLALSPPAHAYLDPGTGSMITAAIVAVFATLVMGIKTYWYKLTALFRSKPKSGQDQDAAPRD